MRFILILVVFSILALITSVYGRRLSSRYSLNNIDDHWTKFKANHSKKYRNASSEARRKQTFKANLQRINQINELYDNETVSYSLDVNEFADLTTQEFMDFVNSGLKNPSINTRGFFSNFSISLFGDNLLTANRTTAKPTTAKRTTAKPTTAKPTTAKPTTAKRTTAKPTTAKRTTANPTTAKPTTAKPTVSAVDWRTSGKVNSIKDQGSICGSCWAFSATSSLESAYAITNGVLPNLSEQNLVDCATSSYGNAGCNGGWYTYAWDYIKKVGINTQTSYPYNATDSTCKYSTSGAFKTLLTGYTQVPAGNEAALAQTIANVGPVSVALYVSSNFQFYKSGLFKDTTCNGKQVNHAVNLVGYGTDSTGDYYILRNSWGTSWGTSGYMNFARNNNNMCSIASYAYYPTVAKASGK